MEWEYFFSIYDLRAALESFEDCLLDSMGYGYNCCCRNGLDELMIPPLTFLSWVFLLCFELVLFASLFFAFGLLPTPLFIFCSFDDL